MFGYCYYLQPTSRPRHSEAVALVAAQCCCCSLPRLYCLFVLSLHYPGRRSGGPQQQSCSEGRSRTCAGNGRRCPWCSESGECAAVRQTGRDSRNSSAGNYDLHTDAGTTTTSLTLAPPLHLHLLSSPPLSSSWRHRRRKPKLL